jgi:hypothetical protein
MKFDFVPKNPRLVAHAVSKWWPVEFSYDNESFHYYFDCNCYSCKAEFLYLYVYFVLGSFYQKIFRIRNQLQQ